MRYKIVFLLMLSLLRISSDSVQAQLPTVDDGLIYMIRGLTNQSIYQYDPKLPISSSNPSLNTSSQSLNFYANGLAVGKNMFSNDGTFTFYLVNSGTATYFYYDINTNAWINTGHSVGHWAAVNPGMGGDFIYSLKAAGKEVWKYDFTGHSSLLATYPDWVTGPFDIVADCSGNFFLLNTGDYYGYGSWLRKYNPNGTMVQEWKLVNFPMNVGGFGFAIVEDSLYADLGGDIYVGIMNDTSVIMTNFFQQFSNADDFATMPIGIIQVQGSNDTMYSCELGSLQFRPFTTDSVKWKILNGNPKISKEDEYLNIEFTGSFRLYIQSFSDCVKGNVVEDTISLFLIDSDTTIHEVVVCESGMPFSFNESSYYDFGEFIVHFRNSYNCDSIVKLRLNKASEYSVNSYDKICPGEIYFFDSLQLTQPGNYSIILKSRFGCDSLVNLTLVEEQTVKVNLRAEPNPVYQGEEVTLQAYSDQSFNIHSWAPFEYFTTHNAHLQEVIFRKPGLYQISVKAGNPANDCVSESSIVVEVLPLNPGIFLPNAFSPNNDGINDRFEPLLVMNRAYKIEHFSIYNRYGQAVFQNLGNVGYWDGTHNGRPCDAGIYFYRLIVNFANKEKYEFKGDIQLMR